MKYQLFASAFTPSTAAIGTLIVDVTDGQAILSQVTSIDPLEVREIGAISTSNPGCLPQLPHVLVGPKGEKGDKGAKGEPGVGAGSELGETRAMFKSGLVHLKSSGSADVVFNEPFSSVPHVMVSPQSDTRDQTTALTAYNVTKKGFTMRGIGNRKGSFAWFATNIKNA